MENSSKALLIAAAVLIVILIVSMSIAILNSAGNSSNEAKKVGDAISSASKDAIDKIIKTEKEEASFSPAEYSVTVNCNGCQPYETNPTVIKEKETITLMFDTNAGSLTEWYYEVEGNKADIIKAEDSNNLTLIIYLANPKGNVVLNVEAVGCCFVAGTQVLLLDGITKNIEDVKVGDKVLSYNETTNEYEEDIVTGLITNPNTTNLARITLVDGTEIEMNEYHPIYTEEGWKSLTNYKGLATLTEDDEVLSVDGEYIEIQAIEQWKENQPIMSYNLSVQNNHNYFVGETSILVHNAGCPT